MFCKNRNFEPYHRMRNPSVTLILKTFGRIISIIAVSLVIIGVSFMSPHMLKRTQLSIISTEANTTSDLSSNLNTSLSPSSPQIYSIESSSWGPGLP